MAKIPSLPSPCLYCDQFDRKGAGGPTCKSNRQYITANIKTGACPLGKWSIDLTAKGKSVTSHTQGAENTKQAFDDHMATIGPPLWGELHLAALTGQLTPEWLAKFALRLPCGTCRGEWLKLVKATPLKPGDDQFEWSYNRHAEVNQRLSKTSPTLAEAQAYWESQKS